MKTVRVLIAAAGVLAAVTAAAAPPSVITPGRWEVTMRTEAPVVTPVQTTELCISRQAAEKPEPPRGKPTDDCRVVNGGLAGNVLAWTTKCSKREVSSRFTYNGDAYEGVIEIKGEGETIRQVVTARRIGDCPEEESVPKPRAD
jgi:Protein of unknown function (DUF3617)